MAAWATHTTIQNMSDAPSIYIETYGCQMNEYDSELVKSILAGRGFGLVDAMDDADVVLLNTCAVRERAHLRIYGRLQGLKKEKAARGGRRLTVGILGCATSRRSRTQRWRDRGSTRGWRA